MIRRYNFIYLVFVGVAIAALLNYSASAEALSLGSFYTDLGEDNHNIERRYQSYILKKDHCKSVTDVNYRVLLGGFGPFAGQSVNLSGLVAMNFARLKNNPEVDLQYFEIGETDFDAIISQDVVEIAGIKVAICAVMTSVIWDLAAAIYMDEANSFRPDLVILSGIDGENDYIGTCEHFAVNEAIPLHGYERDGSESLVTPVPPADDDVTKVFPGGPSTIQMRWDAPKLAAKTNPIVQNHLNGFSVQTSVQENTGTYLCNNVSYVILAGLEGYTVPLAGGAIQMSAHGLNSTKAGFFHYPWSSPQNKNAVTTWIEVISEAIRVSLSLGLTEDNCNNNECAHAYVDY